MQVIADLRDELNDQTGNKVVDVKIPRPADPTTLPVVFGTGNFGKVSCACQSSYMYMQQMSALVCQIQGRCRNL